MKKYLNIVRSRYFIAGLVLILQILQIFVLISLFYKKFIILTIIALMLSFLVILYIIDKDDPVEYKMPWLFITIFLPIVGAVIYVILNNDKLTRVGLKRFNTHIEACKKYKHDHDDVLNKLKKEDYETYRQVCYIKKNAEVNVYGNSRVTYYSTGEEWYENLVDELKKAKKFIFMEYFVASNGKLLNNIINILKDKVKEGVEVYFLYDDFGSIKHLSENFYKDLRKFGIHSIPSNKIVPQLTKILNNRDHRKITIIDGVVGFTGGTNLADEYINLIKPFGYWKDSAVKIEGPAVKNLTRLFLGSWNIQHKNADLDYPKYLSPEFREFTDEGLVLPYSSGPKPFYNENYGKGIYLNIINQAKTYLYITTPYLISDSEVFGALRLAAKRGVDVRIVTPRIPDKKYVFFMTRSNYENLIKDGVNIYEYKPGFIHAKMFLSDDKYATVGSINLDYRSLVHHFECGCYMYKVKALKSIKMDFNDIFDKSIKIDIKDTKYKGFKKLIAEIMKVFSPLL